MDPKIKESEEAVIALVALGKVVAKLAADGLDFSDAVALAKKIIEDGEFRAKLIAGAQGLDKVGEELKHIAASQALELIEDIVHEIKA